MIDDRAFRPPTLAGPDPARVVVVTPPAVELWLATDAEVGHHFRLDSDAADTAYITALLAAARRHVERTTGLALITQTLKATYDRIPRERDLSLPRAPLVSIGAVTYLDGDGATQTFSSASYTTANLGAPGCYGRLVLKSSADWPDADTIAGAFAVQFTAGFGTAATDVPEDLRLAVLWLAAWWYEQRLPVNVGNIVNPVPHHLDDLIAAHRVAFLA